MNIFKTISFYLAILGILLTIVYSQISGKTPPPATYIQKPTTSVFSHFIAASGIVQTEDQNVSVGVPDEGGIVKELFCRVGDVVKQGVAVISLDDQDLIAQLLVQQANLKVKLAELDKVKAKLDRLKNVKDPRAISAEERESLQDDFLVAEAEVAAAEANIKKTLILIHRLTLHAPMDGEIIQLSVRKGERVNKDKPAFIMGNFNNVQMRISIDEQNAGRFNKDAPAMAYPKNNLSIAIPLKFVRLEPYVIPKKNLTGTSDEKVDTRVLEVIYSFIQPENYHMYVGQQADVYIKKDEKE